jgi:hypothetical protein
LAKPCGGKGAEENDPQAEPAENPCPVFVVLRTEGKGETKKKDDE